MSRAETGQSERTRNSFEGTRIDTGQATCNDPYRAISQNVKLPKIFNAKKWTSNISFHFKF